MYYKKNIGGLSLRPGPTLLKKNFLLACEMINPQTWFSKMQWFIHCVSIYFVLFISFRLPRHLTLVGLHLSFPFTEHVVLLTFSFFLLFLD